MFYEFTCQNEENYGTEEGTSAHRIDTISFARA